VLRVRIIDSENGSAPPPVLVSRARYEVDEGFAGFQADERPTLTRRVDQKRKDLMPITTTTQHLELLVLMASPICFLEKERMV
jgi:hypothetical protein